MSKHKKDMVSEFVRVVHWSQTRHKQVCFPTNYESCPEYHCFKIFQPTHVFKTNFNVSTIQTDSFTLCAGNSTVPNSVINYLIYWSSSWKWQESMNWANSALIPAEESRASAKRCSQWSIKEKKKVGDLGTGMFNWWYFAKDSAMRCRKCGSCNSVRVSTREFWQKKHFILFFFSLFQAIPKMFGSQVASIKDGNCGRGHLIWIH